MMNENPVVLALGCFDGVHIGHRSILREAAALGKTLGVPAVGWTLVKDEGMRLCTVPQREKLLREAGMAEVIIEPFEAVRWMDCRQFTSEWLRGRYHAVAAVCGENFRFGKGAAGDAGMLKRLLLAEGCAAVHIMPLLRDETGEPVSSTRIRVLLRSGEATLAAKLLGRPFFVEGEVLQGQRFGHTLGFPTANQRLPAGMAVPASGVYESRVTLPDGSNYRACSHFGRRPTVTQNGELLLESHLLGFRGELYGKTLKTELLRFIRPEQTFSSVADLREQISRDIHSIQ